MRTVGYNVIPLLEALESRLFLAGNIFYASPIGGGTGGSPDSPFLIKNFWPCADPGDTLILLDGRYTGGGSMIAPPAELKGLAGSPITVRALNDGKVHIDGQGVYKPVELGYNDYFVIEGLNLSNSSDTVLSLCNSDYNIIRRVIGWDAADNNTQIFGIHYSEHNLLEDCAGWGIARKIFSASQGGNYNTFRRCFGRWEGSHVVGPKCTFGLVYNNHHNIYENCVGTWDPISMKETYVLQDYYGKPWTGAGAGTYTNYKVQNPYSIFAGDGAYTDPALTPTGGQANVKMLGCIAYILPTVRPVTMFSGIFAANVDAFTIENSASLMQQPIRPFLLSYNTSGTNNSLSARNLTAAGATASYIHTNWNLSNFLNDQTEPYVPQAYDGIGANIQKRYVDGVLTGENLWPWPMDQRIYDAMVLGGYENPIHVTNDILSLTNTDINNPPQAQLIASNITSSTQPKRFSVVYSDSSKINLSSLYTNPIRLTGPNGYDKLATTVSVTSADGGASYTVVYNIPDPSGGWYCTANGTYTVRLSGGLVADIDGNTAVAATLGSFTVNLPNQAPAIASLGASSWVLTKGSTLTLTANGVSDVDGSIANVKFYLDTNNNGVLDAGTDLLLGTDTSSTNGWTWAGSTGGFATGTNRLFAVAADNAGLGSNAVSASVQIKVPPVIDSLWAADVDVTTDQSISLRAEGVRDADGQVSAVDFYRDVNGNGQLDLGADLLLGSDTTQSDGWTWSGSAGAFGAGSHRFLAVARDNDLLNSNTVGLVIQITEPPAPLIETPNQPPEIRSLWASSVCVGKNYRVTLRAGGVNDPDGIVRSVSFYRDANKNRVFDEGVDEYLGIDNKASSGWSITTVTNALKEGSATFFAVGCDDKGSRSNVAATIVMLSEPTSEAVTAVTWQWINSGGAGVVLPSSTEPLASVLLYCDSDSNGDFSSNQDKLLAKINQQAGSWTWQQAAMTFNRKDRIFAVGQYSDGRLTDVLATIELV